MKVLIVEDDRAVMMLTSAYIRSFGHEIETAVSGEEALEKFDPNHIDMVLMDYMLPGINGFETTMRLREIYEDEWFPIIFLTSAHEDEHLSQGLAAGGDDYLYKPVTPVVLEAKLKAMQRIVSMQQELLSVNKQLEQLSVMDGLTQIYNRRGFDRAMESEWKRMQRDKNQLTLLLIDVDYFKKFNDHYGHQAGDDCLIQIAKALDEQLYRPADITARYGGEEFAVLLPGTDTAGAEEVAKRILQVVHAMAIPHEKSDVADHVTISIGVASSDQNLNDSIENLIKSTDKTLYQAKRDGRNRYLTHVAMLEKETNPSA